MVLGFISTVKLLGQRIFGEKILIHVVKLLSNIKTFVFLWPTLLDNGLPDIHQHCVILFGEIFSKFYVRLLL